MRERAGGGGGKVPNRPGQSTEERAARQRLENPGNFLVSVLQSSYPHSLRISQSSVVNNYSECRAVM